MRGNRSLAYKERFPRKYLVFVFSQPLYSVPHWDSISLHPPLAAGDFGPPPRKPVGKKRKSENQLVSPQAERMGLPCRKTPPSPRIFKENV